MRPRDRVLLVLGAMAGISAGCAASDESFDFALDAPVSAEIDARPTINPRMLARFRPLPSAFARGGKSPATAVVALGKRLFEERRLSADGTVSCKSCHDPAAGGDDGEPTSRGVGGRRGGRNAPTVLNAAGQFRQFWDGRAGTIEEQAGGPILNPIEMAMGSEDAVVRVLSADPDYVSRFSEAFGVARNPITFARVTEAIGAYERTLVTPGRWDAYLGGDSEALSEEELSGLKTFLSLGCMSCHTGALLGGSSFERLGLVEPWPNQADPGRLAITKDEADRMSFKVPSLRNVARTAPYFHDGSAPTLEDAIRLMAKHQTGVVLAPEEVDAVAAFLRVLDGDLPEVTQAPTSPGPPTPLVAPSSSAAALAPKAPDVLGLMRGTLSPALDAGDFAKLAAGFRRVKALAPAGYPGWAGYAEAGLAAAASGDFVEARAACAGCHNQYKDAVRKLRTGR